MQRRHFIGMAGLGLMSGGLAKALIAQDELAKSARAALDRACAFMRSIATRGGYLWWYSADLKERAGEGKASETTVWVQPPGTPAVGQAFLGAYDATGDAVHLESARAAADALAYGQLESGGWHYAIDFDPAKDRSLRRAIASDLTAAERSELEALGTKAPDPKPAGKTAAPKFKK